MRCLQRSVICVLGLGGGGRGVPSNSVCACGGREGKLRNSQVARVQRSRGRTGGGVGGGVESRNSVLPKIL